MINFNCDFVEINDLLIEKRLSQKLTNFLLYTKRLKYFKLLYKSKLLFLELNTESLIVLNCFNKIRLVTSKTSDMHDCMGLPSHKPKIKLAGPPREPNDETHYNLPRLIVIVSKYGKPRAGGFLDNTVSLLAAAHCLSCVVCSFLIHSHSVKVEHILLLK